MSLLLAACDGGNDSGADSSADADATLSSGLTLDQRAFEAAEADGGAAAMSWNLPFDGGVLQSPDHYLSASFSGGLVASPSTGPQPLHSTRRNLAPSLVVPAGVATQVIIDGNLLSFNSVRIRYDGGRIVKEYLAAGGVVLWSEAIHDVVVTPLAGPLAASPGRLVDAIPLANWAHGGNLAANAPWKAGSAYITRESLHLGDTVYAQSCLIDSTDVEAPCQGGAVLENAFPQKLLDARDRPYEVDFIEDGDISVVQGLRMWIAREPRSLVASNTQRHRVFYERGGAIHAATLVRDRTPANTRQANGVVVAWSTQLNRAAVDSIEAAFVVNGVRSDGASSATVSGSTVDLFGLGGHGPNGMLASSDLRAHYGVPPELTGAGQTVAIIAQAATGNIAADLNAFSRFQGLPECNDANPCFEHLDLRTDTTIVGDALWGVERTLDAQSIHAMAPGAKIVLVTAAGPLWSDVAAAIARAASIPGITAVTMSFSNAESSSDVAKGAVFAAHPAVAYFASAGDVGHGARFPASSPLVTAVGGTRITHLDWTQTDAAVSWLLSGGGSSRWQARPAWQSSFLGSTAKARGFGSGRVLPDVAALADNMRSGSAIYNRGAWFAGGGTSAAAPLWAAVSALLGEHLASKGRSLPSMIEAASPSGGGFNALLYRAAASNPLGFHDVVTGSNNLSATVCLECAATAGFDAVTGLGEPDVAQLARSLE
ncbi:MAG: Family non-peptidase ue [Rhizobacter sp.]|nr:Family non-peptidase ue [Rhizobacter sp.]